MKTQFALIGASLAIALSACSSNAPRALSPTEKQDETKAVASVLDAWERAIETKNFSTAAATLAPDQEAIHVGTDENEILFGSKSMVDGMNKGLGGLDKAKFTHSDARVVVSKDGSTAWLFGRGEFNMVAEGKPIAIKGVRMTMLLEKREGGWQVVHSHTSVGVPPQPGNIGPK